MGQRGRRHIRPPLSGHDEAATPVRRSPLLLFAGNPNRLPTVPRARNLLGPNPWPPAGTDGQYTYCQMGLTGFPKSKTASGRATALANQAAAESYCSLVALSELDSPRIIAAKVIGLAEVLAVCSESAEPIQVTASYLSDGDGASLAPPIQWRKWIQPRPVVKAMNPHMTLTAEYQ